MWRPGHRIAPVQVAGIASGASADIARPTQYPDGDRLLCGPDRPVTVEIPSTSGSNKRVIAERVVLVCQRASSSGLPGYLESAFAGQGRVVTVADASIGLVRRGWSILRTAHPSRARWYRRRELYDYYSVAAWKRNTRINGRLVDRALMRGGKILQVGGLYAPHPRFRELEYYLFFTYTMKLAEADGYSPWIVPLAERQAFISLETDLYRHAAHIFVAADFVKQNLVSEYSVPPDRISVVGMGVNDWYAAHMGEWPRPISRRCLFVGFTWALKGGPDVIRAFQLARQQIPDLELTIIGPKPSEDMDVPGVTVLGEVLDKGVLLRHYRSSDLFILPSRCDSFGFVFLEAMSQGLVCIGSRLNAMPEIIEDGRTGFIVEPGNAEQIAELIVDTYRNPARMREMGERARDRVVQRFTWNRVADAVGRVLFTPAPAAVDASAFK
jgi:alpha-maltose-1-phosphate synthase